MNSFFVNYYDIKEIKRDIEFLSGGLSKIAKELDIERIGTTHQSGSDSIVTSRVFFKLKNMIFKCWNQSPATAGGKVGHESNFETQFNRMLYGLGTSENDELYL